MIKSLKGLALASVAAVVLPLAANATPIAATISKGNAYSFSNNLTPGSQIEYEFTVAGPLKVDLFVISATGQFKDVKDVTFGFTPATTNTLFVLGTTGTVAGFGTLTGGTFAAGDVISIFLNDGITKSVGTTLSFNTAAVPLPAAGGLLMLALAGTGAIAARKKKSA